MRSENGGIGQLAVGWGESWIHGVVERAVTVKIPGMRRASVISKAPGRSMPRLQRWMDEHADTARNAAEPEGPT
jgi:hypothetical protein